MAHLHNHTATFYIKVLTQPSHMYHWLKQRYLDMGGMRLFRPKQTVVW